MNRKDFPDVMSDVRDAVSRADYKGADEILAALLRDARDFATVSEELIAESVMLSALMLAICRPAYMPEHCALLRRAVREYEKRSSEHTGVHLARFSRALDVLADAVAAQDGDKLVESAEHLSQTWVSYPDTIYPLLYKEVANANALSVELEDLRVTSYAAWYEALRLLAQGDLAPALPLLEKARDRYLRYGYIDDACWLHTDIVLYWLLSHDRDRARDALDAQQHFADALPRSHPGSTRAVHKYLACSRRLLSFFDGERPDDFKAAIDIFTFGWNTYAETFYVSIFNRLRDSVLTVTYPDRYLDSYASAFNLWADVFSNLELGADDRRVWPMFTEVQERLARINFEHEAAIAIADEILVRLMLGHEAAGRRALQQHLESLRRFCPKLFQALKRLAVSINGGDARECITHYVGDRAQHPGPDVLPFIALHFDRFRADLRPTQPAEIVIAGAAVYVDGMLIYGRCPRPLHRILLRLGEEFHAAQQEQRELRPLTGDELAQWLGLTRSAISQSVGRFRRRYLDVTRERTGREAANRHLLLGRSGYRLNREIVSRFEVQEEQTPERLLSDSRRARVRLMEDAR